MHNTSKLNICYALHMIPLIYVDFPFGSWSPWIPDCSPPVSGVTPVNQSRTRSRECTISSDCTPCPLEGETRRGVLQSWSDWGEWSGSLRPCSEKVYRSRRRSCPIVTNPDGYPVILCCNTSSEDVENLCCENFPFGPWSPWKQDCSLPVSGVTPVNQSRTRSRECNISSDCTLCPLDVETGTGILQSWSDWGEWSGSLRPCSEKVYRSRRRSCPNVTNPDGYPVTSCCNSSSEDVENLCCESFPFGSWSPWIPNCSLPVSGVTPVNQSRTRSRECNISSDSTPCPVDVETRTGVLQSWSDWGEWSGSLRPCSEKVYRSRRRSCPNVNDTKGNPLVSCCHNSSEDVGYSCCGSVCSLRIQYCTEGHCVYGCECDSSTVPTSAPSPLTTDQFKCIADPPHCINLQNATIAKLLPCTLKDLCPTTSPGTPTVENATLPEPLQTAPAYEWPVIAVSTFAVIVTAVLIVTIVVFGLLCKKKRQRGYHTLLQQELHHMQPSPTPDEDLPLDPPPPYTAHPSDLTGCGPVGSENISCSSNMDCDPVNTEEVRELFSGEDVTLPLLPPEKKEEEILTTAIHTAQI